MTFIVTLQQAGGTRSRINYETPDGGITLYLREDLCRDLGYPHSLRLAMDDPALYDAHARLDQIGRYADSIVELLREGDTATALELAEAVAALSDAATEATT